MAVPVVQIISGLVALSDAALSVIDRYSKGELTDEELQVAAENVAARVRFAEKVLNRALAAREARGN